MKKRVLALGAAVVIAVVVASVVVFRKKKAAVPEIEEDDQATPSAFGDESNRKAEASIRGIFRMIAGAVLMLLQVLSCLAYKQRNPYTVFNPGYYLGLYAPGIVGIVLLVFGIRAYRKKLYSKLILHSRRRKISAVIKWLGIIVSTLLLIIYILTGIPTIRLELLLNLFGALSFCVYALFYMDKKPSCLFSTALIFLGVGYLYTLISNAYYYMLFGTDLYFYTSILPRLLAGVLYIVVAAIVFREKFSVTGVKILGWIIFALEILHRVVCGVLITQGIYFMSLYNLLELLFVMIVALYLSVLKINTLQESRKE